MLLGCNAESGAGFDELGGEGEREREEREGIERGRGRTGWKAHVVCMAIPGEMSNTGGSLLQGLVRYFTHVRRLCRALTTVFYFGAHNLVKLQTEHA